MYSTLVVGFDGRPEAHDALALAGLLAEPGARVIVALVEPIDPIPASVELVDWGDHLRVEAETRLRGVEPTAVPPGVELERHVVPRGSAGRGLEELAEEVNADVIVVGSTRRGTIGRILAGSTAEALFRGAPCAVAVAPRGFRDAATDRLRVIGVGYDATPEAEHALAAAEALALRTAATLRIVAVVERPIVGPPGVSYAYGEAALGAMEEQADGWLRSALGRLSPTVRPLGINRRGEPATVLAAEAENGMDLLVVGSRGYGPVMRVLLGSVSAKLMRLARCPVLVVPRGVERTASRRAREAATTS